MSAAHALGGLVRLFSLRCEAPSSPLLLGYNHLLLRKRPSLFSLLTSRKPLVDIGAHPSPIRLCWK